MAKLRGAISVAKGEHIQRPSTRLAIAVLSSPSEAARQRRCFQRVAILSLISARDARDWMQLPPDGALLLRYVVTASRRSTDWHALQRESQYHGDVWHTSIDERSTTCFAKIVFAFRHLVTVNGHRPDFIMVGDDDVWLHPPRLLQDLAPLSAKSSFNAVREVLYGLVAFNAGWNRAAAREYGNGVFNVDAGALVRSWRRRRRRGSHSDDGPFPFAYGFCMVISVGLAEVALCEAPSCCLCTFAHGPPLFLSPCITLLPDRRFFTCCQIVSAPCRDYHSDTETQPTQRHQETNCLMMSLRTEYNRMLAAHSLASFSWCGTDRFPG